MKYAYDKSASPLTVELDTSGRGGLGLLEVWVKDDAEATFTIYGSATGEDGTWRFIDELDVPHKGRTDRHEGFMNAYPFTRVVTDSETMSEIEIIAGET